MKIYTYNNKIMDFGGKWMEQPAQPGPGPEPGLSSYTLRLKFIEGVTPTFRKGTAVQVSSSPNVWDLTYENTDWTQIMYEQYDLLEVIDANTTGVMIMNSMFAWCGSLTTVPLFDTSSVSSMNAMFYYCHSLTSIPLFNTSNVTSMNNMFNSCYYVESGVMALYQQASTQTTPPINHTSTFYDCGTNTETGYEELSRIPSDWK